MESKQCQDCEVEGRGKVVITHKDKKAGGQYWANPDGSPHYFHIGEEGGKPQFCHPRTTDEFNWAKDHKGLINCPSYKTPYGDLGIKQDPGPNWEPLLLPGNNEPDSHKTVLSDTNTFIKNVTRTAFELSRDIQPPNAGKKDIQIAACGFIHDFIHMYAAYKIKEDILKVERVVENAMQLLKKP